MVGRNASLAAEEIKGEGRDGKGGRGCGSGWIENEDARRKWMRGTWSRRDSWEQWIVAAVQRAASKIAAICFGRN